MSRRWVPWRPRLKKVGAVDTPLSASKSDIDVLAMLQWLLYLPMIVVWLAWMLELIILMLLIPATVLVRLVLRRPWPVEVRKGFRPWWECLDGNFSSSGQAIHRIAGAIQRGETPLGNR